MDLSRLEDFASRVRGVTKTRALDRAASEALDAFDRASVESLLLKGVALSRLLYSAKQQRGYSDVDLLVPPSDLDRARRALSELGYRNLTAERGVEDIAGAVHGDTWIKADAEIGPLMIDLHSRLPGVQMPAAAAWDVLVAHRAEAELGGRTARVLAREGLALHLATHAVQHGPDDPKPLADLRYGLERWPEPVWQAAAQLARELDAVPAFAAGLRLVGPGAALAETLALPPTDDIEWAMRNRQLRPRGTFHLQAFAEADGVLGRLQVAWRAVYPKREWILWEDPRARLGGHRYVRARVRHMVRAPVWAGRALLYRRRARRGA